MNRHTIWMVIGCGLPLLLIFIAPALGLSGNTSLFIFIIIMFGCHLLMPHGHSENHDNNLPQDKNRHESHQH